MNCANHPELPVAAFCQNCGKPLCTACVRSVSGIIYCEPCLAAKLGIGGVPGAGTGAATGTGTAAGSYTVSGSPSSGYQYTVNQGGYTATGSTNGDVNFTAAGPIPPPQDGPNPGAAFALGFIPGVGAMYNGQFMKAMVHVLVFVVLVAITDNHPIFGIFIAAWIAYQIFDAHQTAKARRDGLPLPDPFGLNELGDKIMPGSAKPSPFPPASAYQPYPPVPPVAPPPGAPSAGFTGSAGFTDPYANPAYTGVPPVDPAVSGFAPIPPVPPQPAPRREPIGAIILIGLGVLFLLNTLDFFRFDWIGHLWPLLIIGLGAWMLIRRNAGTTFSGRKDKDNDTPTPPPAGGAQ
ncbi:LiaI-LiaF-like domain-containing protein [Silvibacterium sp.]|uniref:LiaI-LiaF-like domain-containing protein n=1 Tax=Silvibacterium sp. TaxID=1964179 RepID=UPI0039E2AF9D